MALLNKKIYKNKKKLKKMCAYLCDARAVLRLVGHLGAQVLQQGAHRAQHTRLLLALLHQLAAIHNIILYKPGLEIRDEFTIVRTDLPTLF